MILALFTFVISIGLYLFAPIKYDYNFCVLSLIIFLLSAIHTIKLTVNRRNYFNFHVLFAVSFFYVNFVYPVFLFTSNPYYFPVFKSFKFDQSVISKCTALATLGYAAYGLGVACSYGFKAFNKSEILPIGLPDCKTLAIEKYIIKVLTILLVPLLGYILFISLNGILQRKFDAFDNVPSSLSVLIQVIVNISIILSFRQNLQVVSMMQVIRRFNKLLLLLICFYLFIYIYTGDRGAAIQTVLIFLFTFSFYIKPIKLKTLIILLIAGLFSLTFISYSRNLVGGKGFYSEGVKNTKITSFADIGMDLIVNNRNLYVGYEYANTKGFDYGTNLFLSIFSPFPFLPTIFSKQLFNKTPVELSSSQIITDYSGANYGLGTNLIVDFYMQLGVPGVVFFTFIFGYIFYFFEKRCNSNSIYYYFIVAFFISYSIYMPRSSMFDAIRYIIWGIWIYSFLKSLIKPAISSK